ncbi:SDR family NAD(P)-dependent oxidoreductase [Sphingobium nicotianae]|uniref:SDR family NAD(P)-dependent oxidoreductase n=1 Tax=Sphingobium nicotianae TaxID=2782607 RepID=A0A9X1DAD6_9SPHN|nr:SDR family NAD(P)-dependent oxidoreductase [Sphingobium nicotianae]MBT2186290.1 SDR family NAD(P)-dependent oxidoreductase [Sphingobium nicotianae]
MPDRSIQPAAGTILIVGASRGLGLAIAAEFLRRDWQVIGTVRSRGRTGLHDLSDLHRARLEIETLDITEPDEIGALRNRLSGRSLDMLFVNAGIATGDQQARIGDIATDEFLQVMLTNALSPMRVIDALENLVPADGLIGVMSSGQGSIANNTVGMRDLYRASKAALNMLMKSFAARETRDSRAMLLMAPGWIKTDLGGPDAPFTLEESAPKLVDLLLSKRTKPGLDYLDRDGKTVPW